MFSLADTQADDNHTHNDLYCIIDNFCPSCQGRGGFAYSYGDEGGWEECEVCDGWGDLNPFHQMSAEDHREYQQWIEATICRDDEYPARRVA